MNALDQFRRYLTKPHVRPWALSAPILVLLICLPLLRPLRHPDPRGVSDDELNRLATVDSVVERRTLAIDGSLFAPLAGTMQHGGHTYSRQAPTMAVLLAGPYWVMHRFGLTFGNNVNLVSYLLTLLGVTIPVAFAAGLMYRMGRLFELQRPKRAALAAGVVLGSGLVSYGVVLNSQAPAAALVLAAAACLAHVAISKRPRVTTGWLAIAGLCAALAAVIEPSAAIFALLLAAVIPAMRWRWNMRAGGLLLYVLGMTPPLLLHAMLLGPVGGAVLPAMFHPVLAAHPADASPAPDDVDDYPPGTSTWDVIGRNMERLAAALVGTHGLLSHFPVVLLGLFGVGAVMHRHWPTTTKVLATAAVAGGVVIIVVYCIVTIVGPGMMFGPQWFIVFLPFVLFWSGAWLRRRHHVTSWAAAGTLLVFSIAVTLIGATDPCPRDGYDRYTAAQAFSHLTRDDAIQSPPILAKR
jgi:hypothetical protein